MDAEQDVIAVNWSLPALKEKVHGNHALYTKKYGLLSIGGIQDSRVTSNKIWRLNFTDQYEMQKGWEWQHLLDIEYMESVSSASCLFLDNADSDKLFIIGGYHNDGSADGYTNQAIM